MQNNRYNYRNWFSGNGRRNVTKPFVWKRNTSHAIEQTRSKSTSHERQPKRPHYIAPTYVRRNWDVTWLSIQIITLANTKFISHTALKSQKYLRFLSTDKWSNPDNTVGLKQESDQGLKPLSKTSLPRKFQWVIDKSSYSLLDSFL